MNYWLVKSEPDDCGIQHFVDKGSTAICWDGVRNYQARNFLRKMDTDDLVFLYHSSCKVIGIDINSNKFALAKSLGATECINPRDHKSPIHEVLIEMTGGGLDYTFEAVGNVELMRSALEACHKGWGNRLLIKTCWYRRYLFSSFCSFKRESLTSRRTYERQQSKVGTYSKSI